MAIQSATSGTGLNQLSAELRTFYTKVAVDFAKKNLPHAAFGQIGRAERIPDRYGLTIQWRRFSPLDAATTPLTEGTTPAGVDLTVTAITATVAQYGSFVKFSDIISTTSIDPLLTELSELLGYQAGLTLDTLARDELVANLTQLYPGTATANNEITTAMVLSADLVMEALAILEENDARPFPDGYFVGILSPRSYYTLMQDSTFSNFMMNAQVRGEENPVISGYVGEWLGVKWYRTSNAKVATGAGSTGQDIHYTIILGRDAYGVGGLGADMAASLPLRDDPNTGEKVMPVEIMIVQPGTPSDSDPLGQRGAAGWKTTFVPKVLVPQWGVVIHHSVLV